MATTEPPKLLEKVRFLHALPLRVECREDYNGKTESSQHLVNSWQAGIVAHLGERSVRTGEVGSSNLLDSTNFRREAVIREMESPRQQTNLRVVRLFCEGRLRGHR